jgi:hypothetical protein
MSPDPYGEFHSPYLAMGNNPVSTIDPDGGKTVADPTNIDYDNGRERRVDPFDMVGGSGTREEYYHFDKEGKLVQDVGRLVQIFELGYTASENGVELSNTQDGYAYVYETKSGDLLTITTYNTGEFFVDGVMKEREDEDNKGGDLFGDILKVAEKHFNGSVGTIGVAIQGYKNIPNTIVRDYAYKLSKMTGVKSGQIFQGMKGFANSTGKLVSKLGPAGTLLGIGVIGYELKYDKWDAHTAVNTGLMISAGVATFFAAPAVLTGIALYGVGDYFFDFSGGIDSTIGRDSGVWKP